MKYVVTLNTGGRNCIYDNARSSLREAARRWGAEYFEIVRSTTHHHWHEKTRLLSHLPPNIRVAYFDGDIVVRSDCPSPFAVVPPECFGYVPCRYSDNGLNNVYGPMKQWVRDADTYAAIDFVKHYPNSGVMIFDTTKHKKIFEVATECVNKWGFDGRWEVADQGPFCVAIATSGVPTFRLPGLFNHSGGDLWCCWKETMSQPTNHFCGPNDKNYRIPRTQWDNLGDDKFIDGTNDVRWTQGKPRNLMDGRELPFLIREVSRVESGRIVEIGSYLGGSAYWIGKIAKERKLEFYAVDQWTGAADLQVSEPIYKAFADNMKEAGLETTVQVRKMKSVAAAATFEDESIDLVFVDGDHSKEGVAADIKAYWPKLKIGGVMIGHDYCGAERMALHGVVEAVNACFGCPDEISAGSYPIWKVTKRQKEIVRKDMSADRIASEIKDYLKGKRIAVVGNAGTMNGSGLGPKIDSYDVVIRMNRYDCSSHLAGDVGTRVDIIATNYSNQARNPKEVWDADAPKFILSCGQNPPTAMMYFADRSLLLPDPFKLAGIDQGGKTPTLGCCVIHWLMANVEAAEIFVTGFSYSRIKPDHYHQNYQTAFAHNQHDVIAEGDLFKKQRTANVTVDPFIESVL